MTNREPTTVGIGPVLGGAIVFMILLFVVDSTALDGKGRAWLLSFIPDSKSAPKADASPSSGGEGPAILAAAKKYDSERYVWGGGHPPSSFSKGKGVDCSGLINVAVKEATGVNENNTASSFRNSGHWTKVAAKDAGPGDIMYMIAALHGKSVDHVVIVDKNGGDGKLTIFEAATSQAPVAQQVRGRNNVRYGEFDGALRFKK